MSEKFYFYPGKRWARIVEPLKERIEEENVGMSDTICYLLSIALGVSDAREGLTERRDEQPDTYKTSLRLTIPLWEAISRDMLRRNLNQAATIRAVLHEHYGIPVPEKVKRAPRDPALSSAIIMESQAESFNDMRNLRSSPKEPEAKPVWDRIREAPTEMFLVNLCRWPGCPNSDLGLHKHPGNQLAEYADAVEAGGRT